MATNNLTISPYRDYIAPDACMVLNRKGLTASTAHKWVVNNATQQAFLICRMDDPDYYYTEIPNLPSGVAGQYTYIPAYSTAELLAVMDDLLIRRDFGKWTVCTGNGSDYCDITHESLSHCLYTIMLHQMRNRSLDLRKANIYLHSTVDYI